MRLYVHYDLADPKWALPLVVDTGEVTVGDLLQIFVEADQSRNGRGLNISHLFLVDEKGREVPAATPARTLHAGSDLFVRSRQPATQLQQQPQQQAAPVTTTIPIPAAAATAPTPTTVRATPQNSVAPTANSAAECSLINEANERLRFDCFQQAAMFVAERKMRRALDIYMELLKARPLDLEARESVAEIWVTAKKYRRAKMFLLRRDKQTSWPSSSSSRPTLSPHGYSLLGDCYYELKKYKKAVEAYTRYKETLDPNDPEEVNDATVRLARALYHTGAQEVGNQMLLSILRAAQQQQDPTTGQLPDHSFALKEYGKILMEHGHPADAVHAFMRILATKSKDDEIRLLLTKAMKAAGGHTVLDRLNLEFTTPAQHAAAYAFIAMIIKENGEVDMAADLYRAALRIYPESCSVVLNLVHTLECAQPPPTADTADPRTESAAMAVIREYLASHLDQSVHHITNRMVLRTWLTARGETPDLGEDPPMTSPCGPGVVYHDYELDQLAVWYTLIKVLFLDGKLDIARALIPVLEPSRTGRELHLTIIRNENAYFSCIQRLLSFYPPEMFSRLAWPTQHQPLYVAGDSHCLAPGWQTVTLKGAPYSLVPLLATGLKCWHLRPESNFYPKINFWNVMKKVPANSRVVMIVGDIDCREGILVAVERCFYKDTEDGMKVVIDIYVDVLLRLVREKNLRIYVHPVLPVLNETRPLVLLFNRLLQEKIQATPPLKWLNFFHKLLSPEGTFLPQYHLDGTHIHPSYLVLLERALNKAESSSTDG